MKRIKLILLLGIACIAGCAATQKAIDDSVTWLDKPATTQPNSPTHEQVITGTTAVVGSTTPWGEAIVAGVGVGLYVLRKLSSKEHKTIGEKVDAVLDAVTPAKTPAPDPALAPPTLPAPQ